MQFTLIGPQEHLVRIVDEINFIPLFNSSHTRGFVPCARACRSLNELTLSRNRSPHRRVAVSGQRPRPGMPTRAKLSRACWRPCVTREGNPLSVSPGSASPPGTLVRMAGGSPGTFQPQCPMPRQGAACWARDPTRWSVMQSSSARNIYLSIPLSRVKSPMPNGSSSNLAPSRLLQPTSHQHVYS